MRFSSVLTLILVGSLIAVVMRAQRAEQVLPVKNRDLQTELVRIRAEDQRYRNQMQVEIMKMSSLGTTQQSDQLSPSSKSKMRSTRGTWQGWRKS